MLKLETHLQEALSAQDPKQRQEQLAGLLRRKPTSSYIKGCLGLVGGAFGVAHKSEDRFLLLQASRQHLSESPGFPSVDVPYENGLDFTRNAGGDRSSGLESEWAAFIDVMFIGRRRDHRLSESPPEFYFHLPDVTPITNKYALPVASFELSLLNERGYRSIYCASGEISFFLLAWRLLLAEASHGRLNKFFSWSAETAEGIDLWNSEIWIESLGLPESDWLKTINEMRSRSSETDETKAEEHLAEAQAVSGWDGNYRSAFDKMGFASPQKLWQHLGCFGTNGTPDPVFAETLDFASHICEHLLDRDTPQTKEVDPLTSEMKKYVQEAQDKIVQFLGRGEQLTLSETISSNLHRHLLHIAVAAIATTPGFVEKYDRARPSNARFSIKNLLLGIHRTARFPIIPYFYLVAGESRAKEHVVIALHDSYENQITIGGTTSSAVVLTLLTLNPKIPTLLRDSHYETGFWRQELLTRLYRLQTFLRRAAAPLIDEGFYTGIVVKTAEAEEKLKAAEERAALFDSIRNSVEQLMDAMHEASEPLQHLTGALSPAGALVFGGLTAERFYPPDSGNITLNDRLPPIEVYHDWVPPRSPDELRKRLDHIAAVLITVLGDASRARTPLWDYLKTLFDVPPQGMKRITEALKAKMKSSGTPAFSLSEALEKKERFFVFPSDEELVENLFEVVKWWFHGVYKIQNLNPSVFIKSDGLPLALIEAAFESQDKYLSITDDGSVGRFWVSSYRVIDTIDALDSLLGLTDIETASIVVNGTYPNTKTTLTLKLKGDALGWSTAGVKELADRCKYAQKAQRRGQHVRRGDHLHVILRLLGGLEVKSSGLKIRGTEGCCSITVLFPPESSATQTPARNWTVSWEKTP